MALNPKMTLNNVSHADTCKLTKTIQSPTLNDPSLISTSNVNALLVFYLKTYLSLIISGVILLLRLDLLYYFVVIFSHQSDVALHYV